MTITKTRQKHGNENIIHIIRFRRNEENLVANLIEKKYSNWKLVYQNFGLDSAVLSFEKAPLAYN